MSSHPASVLAIGQPSDIGMSVAPASGAGAAAIAVIRISGPHARAVLEALVGRVPAPRHASLRDIGKPTIDRGLVLWFPAPKSFTGEDMAELQVHGSRAVVQAVVEAATEPVGGHGRIEALQTCAGAGDGVEVEAP